MSINYYRKGRNYELFIRKVYNCQKGKKYGADESFFIDLFLNKLQSHRINRKISPERQFFKVKLYIQKALITLRKRKKYIDSNDHFMPFLLKLQNAETTEDLMHIVNASLAKIIELENELKWSR